MRLHSSWPISVSATNTSWLEKKEKRGSAKARATRRTRMGAFLGGPGQRSPSACLSEPPIQVAAGNSNITARKPNFMHPRLYPQSTIHNQVGRTALGLDCPLDQWRQIAITLTTTGLIVFPGGWSENRKFKMSALTSV